MHTIPAIFVSDSQYMQFAGMYPHVAGKITSHGPYRSTGDVYKVAKLSAEEGKVYKRFEKEFTALTPDRGYMERINQRQSL